MIAIYKITSPSNKVYIGQSWKIEKRFVKYRGMHCAKQPFLYNSFNKHGVENHVFEIIHELPSDISQVVFDNYEKFYWEQYIEAGFEMLNVRTPGKGGKHSKETIIKMCVAQKGRKHSEEARNKIKEKRKLQPKIFGWHHSEETKLKMSISKRGWKLSESHIEVLKRKRTPEEIQKIIIGNQDKTIYQFKNNKTGDEFTGIRDEFRKRYNLDGPSVGRVIKGKIRHTKGWQLISDMLHKYNAKDFIKGTQYVNI